MAKLEQLQEMLAPTISALGFELWGLEFLGQGRHSVLRIFIDREAGISVDDCAEVSHQVSAILDVEDPISGEYTLEVSSPGMDRPLFTLEQYAQFIGHGINVRLRAPFDGRRKFNGVLSAVEGDEVVVVVDENEYVLPIETIDKAHVVPKF